MSEIQLAEASQTEDIPCLLLPLIDINLLVPNVTVAEMAPMIHIDEVDDSPQWLVGIYSWRDIKVPILSYEVLNGSENVLLSSEGRIAVLNNTGIDESLPFIAIPTQGIPRMARVNEHDIEVNAEVEKKPYDLMRVKLGLEEFVIPDVSALEQAYTDYAKAC